MEPGGKSVQHPPLVGSKKFLLQPFRIKFGHIKNYVKSMGKRKAAFKYVRNKFPKICKAKIKESIFIAPQICKSLLD